MPRPPFMNHRAKKKYAYVPPPSSGAHIILVGMLKAEQNELIKNLTKLQVLDYCNRYSKCALKDNAKIWSCMKGLIDKSLIGRHIARDPLYFLNDDGRDLAQKLVAMTEAPDSVAGLAPAESNDEASRDTQSDFASQRSVSNHGFAWNQSDATFELKAGSYEIILVVDQREKIDIVSTDNSVKIETRTLACGDFIWIARPKGTSPYDRTRDLVLDYVIERKRLDDLSSSIFDGRFEQQKHRLLDCGVRRPVYMIEDMAGLRSGGVTSSGLAQAVVNILIQDGIDVEKVKSVAHANDYLMSMSKCLDKFYTNLNLISCTQERIKSGNASSNEFMTYSEFQTKGAKITNWTVREMFAKHLIQIMGMSDKKVAVIIQEYPTLSAMVDAYRDCASEKDKENLLAKLKIPDSNRTVGPAISKRVYACYAMPQDVNLDDED